MHVYWYTINLFRVLLIAICKENHPETMVSMNRCRWKPPYDTLFWATEGLESSLKICGRSLCLKFCWALIFPVSQTQGWEIPNKDHSGSFHWVLWPQVVLFVNCGGFSVIFCVEQNGASSPRKDLPFDVSHRRTTPKWMQLIPRSLFLKNLCVDEIELIFLAFNYQVGLELLSNWSPFSKFLKSPLH